MGNSKACGDDELPDSIHHSSEITNFAEDCLTIYKMYFLIFKPKALKRRSQITPKTHTDVLPLLKKKISRKVGTDALLRARLPPFFSKSFRTFAGFLRFLNVFRPDGFEVDPSIGPFDPDELHPDRGSEFRKSSGIGAFSHEHGSFDSVRYAYVVGEFRGPDDD